MKISELRLKTDSELHKLLQENRERLRLLRFDLASGKIKNVREIRKIKKDIAKILTLLKKPDTNSRIGTNDTNKY